MPGSRGKSQKQSLSLPTPPRHQHAVFTTCNYSHHRDNRWNHVKDSIGQPRHRCLIFVYLGVRDENLASTCLL
jgi:hypothetical protein